MRLTLDIFENDWGVSFCKALQENYCHFPHINRLVYGIFVAPYPSQLHKNFVVQRLGELSTSMRVIFDITEISFDYDCIESYHQLYTEEFNMGTRTRNLNIPWLKYQRGVKIFNPDKEETA